MYRILESKRECKSVIKKFRQELKKYFKSSSYRNYVYPGGDSSKKVPFYIAKKPYGLITVGLPKISWDTREPQLFNINPPEQGSITPDLQINIPFNLARHTGGCFVKSTRDNSLILCHRGIFNAFKGIIPYKISLKYFEERLIEVEDGEKIARVIPITTIGSQEFIRDIFDFTTRVIELRELYLKKKGRISGFRASKKDWWDNDEFEGQILKRTKGKAINYEYLHGTIRNSLKKRLKDFFSNTFEIKGNKNIDLALLKKNQLKAIFEVKTSGDFSDQLYKGIGQLLTYKHFYSQKRSDKKNSPELFLILPQDCFNENTIGVVMNTLDINVILFKDGDFYTSDLTPLNKKSLNRLFNL